MRERQQRRPKKLNCKQTYRKTPTLICRRSLQQESKSKKYKRIAKTIKILKMLKTSKTLKIVKTVKALKTLSTRRLKLNAHQSLNKLI